MFLRCSSAREAAAADGPPEESYLPSDPGSAGGLGPDGHAEDGEDRPGVPAGEHTGSAFSTSWSRVGNIESVPSHFGTLPGTCFNHTVRAGMWMSATAIHLQEDVDVSSTFE